jgi:hypothetical protein
MALPFAAGVGASAVSSIFSLGKSLGQRKLEKNLKRSSFIPSNLKNKLDNQKIRAAATLFPGQKQAEEQLREASSGAVERARNTTRSTSDLLNVVSAVDAQEKKAQIQLSAQQEQSRQQAQRELDRTQTQAASIENQNQLEFQRAKGALRGAADQNLFNAATGAADIVANLADPSAPQSPVGQNVDEVNTVQKRKAKKLNGVEAPTLVDQLPFVTTQLTALRNIFT